MDGVKTRVDGGKLNGWGKTGEEGRVVESAEASAKVHLLKRV